MATPNNPNWNTGYVPSAEEWAAEWSSKVDYPAPVSQGGTGAKDAPTANYGLQQRGLIGATNFLAQPLTRYGIRTLQGTFTIYLPPLITMQYGDWVDFSDVDFNANVNNVTLSGSSGDTIVAFGGTPATTQTLNVQGVRVTLIANITTWSMIVA